MLNAKLQAARAAGPARPSPAPRALTPRVRAVATTPASKPAAPAPSAPGAAAAPSAAAPGYGPSPATKAGAPALAPEAAKDLYYDMVLGREFEEMCAQMYYRGKMFGFVHLYSGQEAVSTGIVRLLRQDDYVCSTYRDHVHALSKGVPPREIMAELFGKATGCCRGQGGSMHMFSAAHGVLGGYAFIGEGGG